MIRLFIGTLVSVWMLLGGTTQAATFEVNVLDSNNLMPVIAAAAASLAPPPSRRVIQGLSEATARTTWRRSTA